METIKFSLQGIEIPAVRVYVHLISSLLILFLTKKTFGKQISGFFRFTYYQLFVFPQRKHRVNEWIATCRKRKGWPQKQDVKSVDLKGMYLQSLTFTISLIGEPEFWRAGFMLGNEKFYAHEIVKPENAITIHIGSNPDSQNDLLAVWKYYNGFSNDNPDSSTVKSENIENISISVDITTKNFLTVEV